MDKGTTEKVISGIPEAFYDGLAYIVPAGYLVLGVLLNLFDNQAIWEVVTGKSVVSDAWTRDLFLALILLAGLYLVGQVMTTISYFIIFKPLDCVFGRNADKNWYNNYNIIKIKHPRVSLLLTKRYARSMSARNMALGNLVLVVLSSITRHWVLLGCFCLVLAIFLYDYVIRKKWLLEFIQSVLRIEIEE